MRRSTEMTRMQTTLSYFGVVAIALAFLACASERAAAQTADTDSAKATVLIYSGRPNPSFALSASQFERLQQLIAAARPDPNFEGESVLPSILGYNGIVVIWSSGNLLAVYGNHSEATERGAKRFLADDGELEDFLLGVAMESKALDDAQLRFIQESRSDREETKP
jgi:hypothetical protein